MQSESGYWLSNVKFIGDISPEHLPDEFLKDVAQELAEFPQLVFVQPESCSQNMIANLARVDDDRTKWYLTQRFIRDVMLELVDACIPVPFKLVEESVSVEEYLARPFELDDEFL